MGCLHLLSQRQQVDYDSNRMDTKAVENTWMAAKGRLMFILLLSLIQNRFIYCLAIYSAFLLCSCNFIIWSINIWFQLQTGYCYLCFIYLTVELHLSSLNILSNLKFEAISFSITSLTNLFSLFFIHYYVVHEAVSCVLYIFISQQLS